MAAIGICTDFVNLPEVARLGFDYVELSLVAVAALGEAEFAELADWVDAAGIHVYAFRDMLPGNLPVTGPGVSATALHDYLKRAFGRARRLGAKVIALDAAQARGVSRDADFPFAWRQLGNFLRLCQGHARECGLVVAVEPLRKTECNLLNLVSEATLLSGLLQLGNVGVAANTGAMAMAAEPVTALSQCGNSLCHVHVEHPLTRRMPREGDGEDWFKLMRVLKRRGYAGGVSVCCNRTADFIADARSALVCLGQAQRN